MLLGQRFEAFVQKSPISVMVRAVLERAFHAPHLDALFERTAVRQYTRELLFSTLVALMSEVVLGISRSIRTAYQQSEEKPSVSITSVYNKLNGVEAAVSAALVRDSAAQLGPLIRQSGRYGPRVAAGLSGADSRRQPSGGDRASAPGTADDAGGGPAGPDAGGPGPRIGAGGRCGPCEDGHAQERALLGEVLPTVEPGDLWMADRNFCTTGFLFGIAGSRGLFPDPPARLDADVEAPRAAKTLRKNGFGHRSMSSPCELSNPATGATLRVRRITVELHKPTRDGETEIHLLTNVPALAADALTLSNLYLERWTIETMFQTLTVALTCEIKTLGYPQAALFGFCLAVVAYNAVSLVHASLRAVHGPEIVEKQVSWYYVCTHLAKVYEGMMMAVPARHWRSFREMEEAAFVGVPATTGDEHRLGEISETSAWSQKATAEENQWSQDQTCSDSPNYRKTLTEIHLDRAGSQPTLRTTRHHSRSFRWPASRLR